MSKTKVVCTNTKVVGRKKTTLFIDATVVSLDDAIAYPMGRSLSLESKVGFLNKEVLSSNDEVVRSRPLDGEAFE